MWSLVCFAFGLSTAFKRSRLFDPESLGRWQRDSVREVDIVTGCLLLVPRKRWNELGGFDTRFFMYGEEADFALRAAKAGLRPIITPDSVITHEVGASSKVRSDKVILLYQGKATLVRKHWSGARRSVGLGLLWLGVGLRATFAKLMPRAERQSVWPQVWGARRRWFAGYPTVAAPTMGVWRARSRSTESRNDGLQSDVAGRVSVAAHERACLEAERRDDEEDQRGLNERERIEEGHAGGVAGAGDRTRRQQIAVIPARCFDLLASRMALPHTNQTAPMRPIRPSETRVLRYWLSKMIAGPDVSRETCALPGTPDVDLAAVDSEAHEG